MLNSRPLTWGAHPDSWEGDPGEDDGSPARRPPEDSTRSPSTCSSHSVCFKLKRVSLNVYILKLEHFSNNEAQRAHPGREKKGLLLRRPELKSLCSVPPPRGLRQTRKGVAAPWQPHSQRRHRTAVTAPEKTHSRQPG